MILWRDSERRMGVKEVSERMEERRKLLTSDGKFMAMLRSDNFKREQIENEYKKLLRKFLRQNNDTKLKKLIEDNKEMFLEEFKERLNVGSETILYSESEVLYNDSPEAPSFEEFHQPMEETEYDIAAENPFQWSEETRLEVFGKALRKAIGYDPKITFPKQKVWEAVYRIAADYGFTIDGDYERFIDFVKKMNLTGLPNIDEATITRFNTGIYSKHIDD